MHESSFAQQILAPVQREAACPRCGPVGKLAPNADLVVEAIDVRDDDEGEGRGGQEEA